MIRAFLQLIRLPNGFTAASNVVVGSAMAQSMGTTQVPWNKLGVASLGAFFLYGFGMALNDIADYEKDQSVHPERPLPSGRISTKAAKNLAVCLLLAGMSCLWLADPVLLLVGLALVFAIVLYDVVLKPTPVAASAAMGMCRFSCVFVGIFLAGSINGEWEVIRTWQSLQLPLVYLLLITVVTAISCFEEAPRNTFPARPFAIILGFLYFTPLQAQGEGRVLAWGASALLAAMVLAPCFDDSPKAGLMVRNAIFTLPLFDALWCFSAGQGTFALLSVGCYVMLRGTAWGLNQVSS